MHVAISQPTAPTISTAPMVNFTLVFMLESYWGKPRVAREFAVQSSSPRHHGAFTPAGQILHRNGPRRVIVSRQFILVGVDDSEAARRGLAVAQDLARAIGGQCQLVHAVKNPWASSPQPQGAHA
jgi:hypothetical protein